MKNINLPLGLLTDKHLTPSERTIYAYINETAKETGYIEFSDQKLADDLAINLTTIKRSLTYLDRKGYISRKTQNIEFIPTRKIYPLKQF